MIEMRFDVEGGDFTRAGNASSEIKKTLKQLAIAPKTIKRIVVALYEAEVNVAAHAYKGVVSAVIDDDKIEVQVRDQGPGIANIAQAMEAGYSTASESVRQMGFGAGMGLPNIKKNSDELHIESTVGQGTTLRMITYFA